MTRVEIKSVFRSFQTMGFLGILCAVGCVAKETERPPALECDGDNCFSNSSGVNGSASGGQGNGGNGGGAGTDVGNAGAPTEVTVQGKIVEIDEPVFSVKEAYLASGDFKISVPGANGKDLSTITSAEFTIGGVKPSKTLWLSATPTTNNDQYAGLIALDTTSSLSSVVPIVRKSSLELVASVLNLPLTLSSNAGQVVLRFVDKKGTAVSGVKVAVSGAENIAYDTGTSYTDDSATGTGKRGLCFLLNMDASATPSAKYVSLSGSVTAEFALWVKSGAATALELTLSQI
jgi:hypothetical protein